MLIIIFEFHRWSYITNAYFTFRHRHPWIRNSNKMVLHVDVVNWKHFPRYWPFVRGNSPFTGEFPRKGQWRGAWMISLICTRINGWVNNREAGDLRRHHAQYDVTVMRCYWLLKPSITLRISWQRMSDNITIQIHVPSTSFQWIPSNNF